MNRPAFQRPLPFRARIRVDGMENSSTSGTMMPVRWSIREIGRVGAGSSLDEDERVWYDLNKRDDGIRP